MFCLRVCHYDFPQTCHGGEGGRRRGGSVIEILRGFSPAHLFESVKNKQRGCGSCPHYVSTAGIFSKIHF